MANTNVIKGRPVSAAALLAFANLQALEDPAKGLSQLDGYAKWIFATSTVVATLATGLSAVGFGNLLGAARLVYTAAVAALGLSLVAAATSLRPQSFKFSPDSPDSLLKVLDEQFIYRSKRVRLASILFASALFLASVVPLTGIVQRAVATPTMHVGFTMASCGGLSVTGAAMNAFGDVVELRVEDQKSGSAPLLRSRTVIDTSGVLRVAFATTNLGRNHKALHITGMLLGNADMVIKKDESTITIPEPPDSSCGAPSPLVSTAPSTLAPPPRTP
jgi:hypothetical protein